MILFEYNECTKYLLVCLPTTLPFHEVNPFPNFWENHASFFLPLIFVGWEPFSAFWAHQPTQCMLRSELVIADSWVNTKAQILGKNNIVKEEKERKISFRFFADVCRCRVPFFSLSTTMTLHGVIWFFARMCVWHVCDIKQPKNYVLHKPNGF